jgi:hypothetical protein
MENAKLKVQNEKLGLRPGTGDKAQTEDRKFGR